MGKGFPATLFLSLNIPGPEKAPPGAEALFSWVMRELVSAFPQRLVICETRDLLGPYAILGVDGDPSAVKRRCVDLESGQPASRLIDLDVYARDGAQVGRAALGLAARSCLVCDQPAVDCMRTGRHSFNETIGKVHELLAPFRT